jgi:hypothetical protein
MSTEFIQVFTSEHVKGALGVCARVPIPANTFLGFYRGDVVMPEDVEISRDLFKFSKLFSFNDSQFIDAKDVLSCFARYYQYSRIITSANVCVRHFISNDPQTSVGFFTTIDVIEGDELLIPCGCEVSGNMTAAASPAFRRVRMTLKSGFHYNFKHN